MSPETKICKFLISEEESGTRIDIFLASVLPERSRSYIQKLLKEGNGLVKNRKVKASYILNEGDEVRLFNPPRQSWAPTPEPIEIDIVYEDSEIVVINKKAGMVVHPGAGNRSGTLVHALLYHCGTLSRIGGLLRPGIVHRLDKGTSGLLVAAKTDQAYLSLVSQLAERKMKRVYIALVSGHVRDQKGTIDLPIGRDPKRRERMAVNRDTGKPAVTHYEVMKRGANVTLLRVFLETGRTHQIRVHMRHIGHSVIGDAEYGLDKMMIPDGVDAEELVLIRKLNKINHPLLHAECLEILRPGTNEKMEFKASPPPEFTEVLDYL